MVWVHIIKKDSSLIVFTHITFFSLVKHRTKMILVFTGKVEISYLCKNGIISNIYGPFTVNDESKSAGIIS